MEKMTRSELIDLAMQHGGQTNLYVKPQDEDTFLVGVCATCGHSHDTSDTWFHLPCDGPGAGGLSSEADAIEDEDERRAFIEDSLDDALVSIEME